MSTRATARQNLLVASVNAALEQHLITLECEPVTGAVLRVQYWTVSGNCLRQRCRVRRSCYPRHCLSDQAGAKIRVLCRCGKHYGKITAKHFAVLRALLWNFHNAISGKCFPSYKAIADKAACALLTVAAAIKALEEAGILTWVNRIRRVHERVVDLFGEGAHGQRSRVLRTSNGYRFTEPADVQRSESELPSGTAGVARGRRPRCAPPRIPD